MTLADISFAHLQEKFPTLQNLTPEVAEQLEIMGRYKGYLARQQADIDAFQKEEGMHIPANIDYQKIAGLSREIVERLNEQKPDTIGDLKQMRGITPASVNIILGYLKNK